MSAVSRRWWDFRPCRGGCGHSTLNPVVVGSAADPGKPQVRGRRPLHAHRSANDVEAQRVSARSRWKQTDHPNRSSACTCRSVTTPGHGCPGGRSRCGTAVGHAGPVLVASTARGSWPPRWPADNAVSSSLDAPNGMGKLWTPHPPTNGLTSRERQPPGTAGSSQIST